MFTVNVGKYTAHGCYGWGIFGNHLVDCRRKPLWQSKWWHMIVLGNFDLLNSDLVTSLLIACKYKVVVWSFFCGSLFWANDPIWQIFFQIGWNHHLVRCEYTSGMVEFNFCPAFFEQVFACSFPAEEAESRFTLPPEHRVFCTKTNWTVIWKVPFLKASGKKQQHHEQRHCACASKCGGAMCRLRLWRLCDLRALEREEGAQFPAAVDLIESFQNERGLTIHIIIV